MGTIIAVCTSPEKGTAKQNVHRARLIENHGLEQDAHAGAWHRQVSLLSYESVSYTHLIGDLLEFIPPSKDS